VLTLDLQPEAYPALGTFEQVPEIPVQAARSTAMRIVASAT